MNKVHASPEKNHRYQLVVEGKDKYFFIHLLEKHFEAQPISDDQKPYVHQAGGLKEALSYAKQLLRAEQGVYTKIGLVVDADEDCHARWTSIKNILSQFQCVAPERCPPGGWVQTTGAGVRVGVWVMPNNVDPGKLETFLAALVPQEDAVWPWAREATEGAKSRGAGFPEKDRIKAEIHAWLAWQEEPGKPFGTSVKAGYFRHDVPEAQAWLGWFRRLFLE
jgi:hypothetical protein